MIPFRLTLRPGIPVHEQVGYAARRAIVAGQLRPGDAFPSVRALSRELKINPNTAHKVVTQLVSEGTLEVVPGIGTVVAVPKPGARADRARLLGHELEQLIVEARRLGLRLDDVQRAVAEHWNKLTATVTT